MVFVDAELCLHVHILHSSSTPFFVSLSLVQLHNEQTDLNFGRSSEQFGGGPSASPRRLALCCLSLG